MVLDQQVTNLTLCFYENPAAQQEIKFWEGLVDDKIQSKSFVDDNWTYHLQDGDSHELVVCIPLQDTILFRGIEQVSKIANDKFDLHSPPHKLKYHKTLVFGKVEIDQLKFITILMGLMSKGKWR